MNKPVIGIKLSDGSFYPVLRHGTAEKKKLILTVANREQEKAVIEVFRSEGDEMEVPEKLGSLVVDDVGGSEHDIELVLETDGSGEFKASARVSGSHQSKFLEVNLETTDFTENEEKNDLKVLQDDSILEDGIDDFNEPSDGNDLTTDLSNDLDDFSLGDLDSEQMPEESTNKPALDDLETFSFDDEETPSDEKTDSLDDESFTDADDEEETGKTSANDFSLDDISLDEEPGTEDTFFGESETTEPQSSETENLDDTSFSFEDDMGEASSELDSFGGEVNDDLAWSPPEDDGLNSDDMRLDSQTDFPESDEVTEQVPEKKPREAKSVRPEKPVKTKPAKAVQPSVKKDPQQPDRMALILGMVVFIPLALLLIVLVVLNMIRPVYTPPLVQTPYESSLVTGVVQTQSGETEVKTVYRFPFV